MKIEKTIIETVCDYCTGDYRVKSCSVCGADACGKHHMMLFEHDLLDRPSSTFIMCFKCIPEEIMEPYVEMMRNNTGDSRWGLEWVSKFLLNHERG